MALTLKELYSDTRNKYNLSLVAGESGLNRIMSWVYVSEDLNTADFLMGGELVITTGVSCATTENWLYQFVKNMIDHNTSGLILNTGKYIHKEDITPDIIALCEQAEFALFTMPWEIHIYNISKDYYNRIFLESQEDSSLTKAFLSVIHQDTDYAKSIHMLEDHGYTLSSTYCIGIIDISDFVDIFPHISYSINSLLRKSKVRCELIHAQNKLILICNDQHNDRIYDLLAELVSRFTGYKKGLTVHEGIGGIVTSLKRLNTSYNQANAALSMAHYHNQEIYNYRDMGFFKLLLAVGDESLLNTYVKDLIGDIQEYDNAHNSNYTETLRAFLINDGSIQAIASDLFCHRNTVNYRIRTLKENFGLELDHPGVRFDLMTAYLIVDYLALQR